MSRKLFLSLCLSLVLVTTVFGQAPSRGNLFDYAAMYETLNPSIVKIHTDSGSGSGFVVQQNGLIATNHHVVRNTRYLAVEFSDGRKVKGEVVILNPRYDLALVKVNSSLTSSLKPLALLPPEKDVTVERGYQ